MKMTLSGLCMVLLVSCDARVREASPDGGLLGPLVALGAIAALELYWCVREAQARSRE
jgi:hypothetical protein